MPSSKYLLSFCIVLKDSKYLLSLYSLQSNLGITAAIVLNLGPVLALVKERVKVTWMRNDTEFTGA